MIVMPAKIRRVRQIRMIFRVFWLKKVQKPPYPYGLTRVFAVYEDVFPKS